MTDLVIEDKRYWERQDNESLKAFEAFEMYLFMEDPTAKKVAERLDKSHKLTQGWCTKYNWVHRRRAYEDYLARKRAEDYEKKRLQERYERQQIIDILEGMAVDLARELKNRTEAMTPKDFHAYVSGVTKILEQSRQEYNDLPTRRHQLDVNIQQEIIALIQAGEVDVDMLAEVVGDKEHAVQLFQQAGIDAF